MWFFLRDELRIAVRKRLERSKEWAMIWVELLSPDLSCAYRERKERSLFSKYGRGAEDRGEPTVQHIQVACRSLIPTKP